jgi:HTH-type transcriptional regulator / antitoxin HigA
MKPKLIKTEEDYEAAMAYLEDLMDAEPGSPEAEELELFSVLIELYEKQNFPIELPDPIEAIKFRMEQQRLTRRDLELFIGSQSKVSEILNRKRPLSLSMIRALHTGLGIPAEVLLQEPGRELEPARYDPAAFPFNEMYHQGYFSWFKGSFSEAKEEAEELLEQLFAPFSNTPAQRIYCRQSRVLRIDQISFDSRVAESSSTYTVAAEDKERSMHRLDINAVMAWHAHALALAEKEKLAPYFHEKITTGFIGEVVKLSGFSQGPLIARELLNKRGIPLVIVPHLSHTYLDGACFFTSSGRAAIALTIRHDRLDNFWFTLVHELAHIHLHLNDRRLAFFDDTEGASRDSGDPLEDEANRLTGELLIPSELWESEKDKLKDETDILAFADLLGISPAIVAGRLGWENQDYGRFTRLLGQRSVRKLFGIR